METSIYKYTYPEQRKVKDPKTEQEKEVLRGLQVAAYHCAPAVESFTRSRKQDFAQRTLYNHPGIPSLTFHEQHLFSSDHYADILDSPRPVDGPTQTPSMTDSTSDCAHDDQRKHMECIAISETHIQNNTCVLAPEVTEGPYYHIEGHPIRRNVAEYQDGLLLLLDIGVIDVETCKPLPNVLVDIWQANATGWYAGHPVPYEHLKDENPAQSGHRKGLLTAYPRTLPRETWLRGAWPTDKNGVAQFTTIYPGYYSGRATHIHAKAFTEWGLLPKSPESHHTFFRPSRLAHVGQFFFSEDLNTVVDDMYPYINNPIRHIRGRTLNLQDSLNIFNESHGPEGKYNPVFQTHLIGGVIRQGLVSFITMGINASASYDKDYNP